MLNALVRPFKLWFSEPIVQLFGLYMAFVYGLFYCTQKFLRASHPCGADSIHAREVFITTMPSIFEGIYHEPVGTAGLHYFALGVGLTGASQFNARTMDRVYVYFKTKNGGVGKPEYRLREFSFSSRGVLSRLVRCMLKATL